MKDIIRSHEEIAARIELVKGDDFLGTEVGDLMIHLPFEQAKTWLKDDAFQADFDEVAAAEADVQKVATAYLDFAVGKAVNHRGLSAGRSVSHFRAWLWLILPDDQFDLFENAEYSQYGVPKIKAAAQLLDAESVWDAMVKIDPELARMAEGDMCRPGCDEGCGS